MSKTSSLSPLFSKTDLKLYDYLVPKDRIAQTPAEPRDSAKLFVYDRTTQTNTHSVFKNIGMFLPPQSVLVLNQTKVIPARLNATKESGGRVELLFIRQEGKKVHMLASKKLSAGSIVTASGSHQFRVEEKARGYYVLRPLFDIQLLASLFAAEGKTPLPPYIKQTNISEASLRERYQSVFAKHNGSAAAPTASLHFTNSLLQSLEAAGHELMFITLHVGLGTFAPISEEHLTSGRLHSEWYEILSGAADRINRARTAGRPIIAVGTTAARALEAAGQTGVVQSGSGTTDIFIRPGHRWNIVDHLITNFHVPKSSLLMLVASLVGREKILDLYKEAIEKNYRFFSFGDAMLIL